MATLNIPSSVDDPNYRYKMPRVISTKQGKPGSNGSKTAVVNLSDVARAVQRDPVYVIKFFGYELGAQVSYTNKESEGPRAVVNGHHETHAFQTLVDKFIEKYVLCVGCKLPEVDMVVNSKKGLVVATCKACGWSGKLDNEHKLATYIVKYPPAVGIGFDEERGKKSREDRKKEKQERQKQRADGDEDTASYQSDDGGDGTKKERNDKKDKKVKKEKKGSKYQIGNRDVDGDEDTASYQSDDDGDGTKKERNDKKDKKDKKENKGSKEHIGKHDGIDGAKAMKDEAGKKEHHIKSTCKKDTNENTRNNEEPGSCSDIKKVSDDDELELSYADEIMTATVKDVTEFVANQKTLTVDTLFEKVRSLQVIKVFDNRLRMFVVVSALFPESSLNAEEIVSKKKFVKEFITKGTVPFPDWIWGFEAYLVTNLEAAKGFPMTMKAMYEEELVPEEEILKHYRGVGSGSLGFKKAQKVLGGFLTWLEKPDSDSD